MIARRCVGSSAEDRYAKPYRKPRLAEARELAAMLAGLTTADDEGARDGAPSAEDLLAAGGRYAAFLARQLEPGPAVSPRTPAGADLA